MELLTSSLLELITQTSTNLPPDVRAAMSLTAGAETPASPLAEIKQCSRQISSTPRPPNWRP